MRPSSASARRALDGIAPENLAELPWEERSKWKGRLGGGLTLLRVGVADAELVIDEEAGKAITDARVPVGAYTFHVADGHGFKPGDQVIVRRYGNAEWIHTIRMDRIPDKWTGKPSKQWTPFPIDLERVVTAVDGNAITIDAPVAVAVDDQWGGGSVIPYTDPQRLENVGIEHLRLQAFIDKSITWARDGGEEHLADEGGCGGAIGLGHVKHSWVRNCTHVNFGGGITANDASKYVTIQDCVALDMTGKLIGGRRYPFGLGKSQMILFLRCYAETARHSYAIGSKTPGPNAIVDCLESKVYSDSEPHHRYSVGGIFDNHIGNVKVQDRQSMGSGQGWQGANYLLWNTRGNATTNSPETARNMTIGHIGMRGLGTFVYAAFEWLKQNPEEPWQDNHKIQQGYWESHGLHVSPRSLYLAQLEDRLGPEALTAVAIPEQISGSPVEAILAHAEAQGAVYTDLVRERVQDNRSWVRVNRKDKSEYEHAVIKTESGLLEYELKNHWEYPPGEGPVAWQGE